MLLPLLQQLGMFGAVYDVAQTETVSAGDSQSAVFVTASVQADSLTSSESETTILIAASELAESLTSSESSSDTFDAVAVLTEPVTSSDSQVVVTTFVSAQSESVTAAEASTSLFDAVSDRTEPLTVSDAQVVIGTFVGELSESLTALDEQAATFVTVAAIDESLTADDSETALDQDEAVRTESLTVNESSVSAVEFVASVSETLEVTESNTGQIEGAAQVFDVDLTESLNAADVADASTVSPSTGGGGLRLIPWQRSLPRPTYTIAPQRTLTGNVVAIVTAIHVQSATTTVSTSYGEEVFVHAEAISSCDFGCIIQESTRISDYIDAEVVPWILETIKIEGATLYLHNDSTISLDLEEGVSIDVMVRKGEASAVLEIPVAELI